MCVSSGPDTRLSPRVPTLRYTGAKKVGLLLEVVSGDQKKLHCAVVSLACQSPPEWTLSPGGPELPEIPIGVP